MTWQSQPIDTDTWIDESCLAVSSEETVVNQESSCEFYISSLSFYKHRLTNESVCEICSSVLFDGNFIKLVNQWDPLWTLPVRLIEWTPRNPMRRRSMISSDSCVPMLGAVIVVWRSQLIHLLFQWETH